MKKMMTGERNSNIEFLRIVCMLGIIIGHCWNPVMGGGANYIGNNNIYVFYFLLCLTSCAVNLFVLISGYFLCQNSQRNLIKPALLLIQVIIFKLGGFVVKVLLGKSVSGFELVKCFVPNNYFVILYSVLYLISPYINVVLYKLDKKQWKQLLIISLSVFSIFPTLVDVGGEVMGMELLGLSTIGLYGSQWGYSIVNFILMYILGAYIRMEDNAKGNILKISVGIVCCGVCLTAWSRLNDFTGYFVEKSALEYCNPVVILLAVLMFKLLYSFKSKQNLLINKLAKGSFSVFLFQNEIINYLPIELIMKGNEIIVISKLLFVAVAIYLCGWLLGILYTCFECLIRKRFLTYFGNFELQYPE